MAASIVTVVNQKGGAGKTMLAMQLAGAVARRGEKVLVVDADPQGTATRWSASAPEERPFPAAVSGLSNAGGRVHLEVRKFVDDYHLIVIDCPPAMDSPAPESALLIADVALVPVRPLPAELWASVGIRKMVERQQTLNEGLKVRIVVSDLEPRTRLARSVMDNLSAFGIPLMHTILHHRVAYPESMILGGTVHTLGSTAKPAIEEVEALTNEVLELLRKED